MIALTMDQKIRLNGRREICFLAVSNTLKYEGTMYIYNEYSTTGIHYINGAHQVLTV